MNPSSHPIPSGLAAVICRRNRRPRIASSVDFVQEPARRRVVSELHAMSSSLPFSIAEDPSLDRAGRLVNSVIIAFVEGDLKPGDPFPEPSELAPACHIPLHEVLAAIAYLLSHGILQQDRSGALRIHRKAAPTIEMKQHAFLACARELVGQARTWRLPPCCLDQLFNKATREKP